MQDSLSFDSRLDELRKALEERKYDDLENIWMELAESPESVENTLDSLTAVARGLVSAGEKARAAAMMELIYPAVTESSSELDEKRLAFYELLLRVVPGNQEYRTVFADAFEELHGPTSVERCFFECCGLREGVSADLALERLDNLRKFAPGAFVYHSSGWGAGKVLEVDPHLKQIKVDLEHKKDHRIAMEAADSILEVLPAESFRALELESGDELQRLAEEEPVEMISRLIESFGNPIALKEIKSRLVPGVIVAKSWNRWWNATKVRLRESGYFRVGDRAPYQVAKLESATNYEDELLEHFRSSEWTEARQAARLVMRGGDRKFPRAYSVVRDELLRMALASDVASVAIDAALLLARREDKGDAAEALVNALSRAPLDALISALEGMSQTEECRRALDPLEAARPEDWLDALKGCFWSRSDALREVAFTMADRHGEEHGKAFVTELLRAPRLAPAAFCWLVDRRLSGDTSGSLAHLESLSSKDFLVLLLDLMEHLVDRDARRVGPGNTMKDLYRKVDTLLYHGGSGFFREAIRDVPAEQVAGIYHQLVRNSERLPTGLKLLEVIDEVRPGIGAPERAEHVWWDVESIYVTRQGLAKRQKEFLVLTEDKIPAIFEAIGKAAEFGDLSENAEFTSAVEERDLLTTRASTIEKELAKAKLLEPGDVRPGPIGLGHRVTVEDLDTGEELSYSVLGPWDGSPEEGVISYRSPLGEIFIGRESGEEFVAKLPGGSKRYKILDVQSHFD